MVIVGRADQITAACDGGNRVDIPHQIIQLDNGTAVSTTGGGGDVCGAGQRNVATVMIGFVTSP